MRGRNGTLAPVFFIEGAIAPLVSPPLTPRIDATDVYAVIRPPGTAVGVPKYTNEKVIDVNKCTPPMGFFRETISRPIGGAAP